MDTPTPIVAAAAPEQISQAQQSPAQAGAAQQNEPARPSMSATHNEPLGMPRGSVRAIITLIALLGYALAAAYSMVKAAPVPEGLTSIAMTVIAFYFGSRSGAESPKTNTNSQADGSV